MDCVFIYCEDFSTTLKTSKFYLIDYLKNRNHRIIYCETPVSIFSIFKYYKYFFKNIKKFISSINKENLIITSFINFFPFHKGFRFDFFNQLNQKLNILKINLLIKKNNFKNVRLFIYSPLLYSSYKQINNLKSISFIINDDYAGFDKQNNHLIEKYITYFFEKSDLVYYNSKIYYKYIVEKFNLSKSTYHIKIPHGIDKKDLSFYKKTILPNNLKLKFFYYGQLSKINFEIIRTLANNYKDFSFHLFGPSSKNSTQFFKIDKFDHSNIFIHDSLDKKNLILKIAELDIAILPFKSNNLTNFMLPIKIFELIYLKIPIICTKNDTIQDVFKDNLYYLENKNILKSFEIAVAKIVKSKYETNYNFKIFEWNEIYKKFFII